MSSDSELASIVAGLRFSNYVSLAIATAVAYDYVITFSKEINYVWNRPRSFVSAMFVLIRYLGLFVALWKYFHTWTHLGTVLLLVSDYAFIAFLAAADIVMILRVYAMYNRSKNVLGLLLVLYVTTIFLYVISSAFYDDPSTNLTMTTPHVLDMSFCSPEFVRTVKLGKYKEVPRLTLAGLLLVLVLARLFMDAFEAYKVIKRWETSRYIDLFVKEGVLYFLAHLLNNIEFGQSAPGLIANAIIFTVMFVLSPRFVMNVRALHVHNVARAGEQNIGIDTGFGITKDKSSPTTAISSVAFVHQVGTDTQEESVEMQTVVSEC